MSYQARNFRGEIAYLRDGSVRTGREWFSTTVYPDGTRTMRAECHFENSDLIRDVTFTLDASWRPVDAYLRVSQSRRFLGSGWYFFGDRGTTCEAMDASLNRQHYQLASDSRTPACGYHPISNDAVWTALFDLSRRDEMQEFPGCITYSKEQIGNERIGIETFDLQIRHLGDRRVAVPAGTVDAQQFAVLIKGLDAPFMISTWSDDYVLVKETWEQMPGESFELAVLQR